MLHADVSFDCLNYHLLIHHYYLAAGLNDDGDYLSWDFFLTLIFAQSRRSAGVGCSASFC
jgi:hypothetical protein